jgi:hypothetical protein
MNVQKGQNWFLSQGLSTEPVLEGPVFAYLETGIISQGCHLSTIYRVVKQLL